MKNFKIIYCFFLLTLFSCSKEKIVEVLNNNLTIVDERSSKKTNGIDVYSDLEKENENYISLQTNASNYTCSQSIIPYPLLTASLRTLEVDVKGFRISGNEFILNDKNGFYLPPNKNQELVNLFNTNAVIEVFDENDVIVGEMEYHIAKNFCPSGGNYNHELGRFEITSGQNLNVNWDNDANNEFSVAFGISKHRIGVSTKEAYIKFVDDNGSVSIPGSEIDENCTLTVASFAENEIFLNTGEKISVVTIHYSIFPVHLIK